VIDRDRRFIDASIRDQFAGSLNTEEAFREGHDQEPRRHYLLGHAGNRLIAVEPHSAKTDEVQTVINKKNALKQQIQDHPRDGRTINIWLWVSSGQVCFPRGSKHEIKPSQAGIKFAGRLVMLKHLS
jgi:hypothetical protein